MPTNDEEILSRLELTIQSWSGEVTTAHDTLSQQIGEAKDQLSTLMRVIASRNQNGHAITDALEELQATKKQLARSAENLAGALEENARIKDQLHDGDTGGGATSEAIEKYENTIEDLNHELSQARDELKASETEIRERDEALRAATQDAASFNETLSAVQEEIEALHAATDEELTEGTPEEKLQALEREVNEAVEYEEDLADQFEQTQIDLEETKTALMTAEEKLTKLQRQLDEKTDDLATVQQQLDEKTLETTNADSTVQQILDEKTAELTTLQQQLNEKMNETATADSTVQQNLDEKTHDLAAAQSTIDTLQDDLERKSSAQERLEKQLDNDQEIRSESDQAVRKNQVMMATELAEAQAQIDRLKSALADREDTIEKMHEADTTPPEPETILIDSDEAQLEDPQEQNRELEATLRDRDAEIDDLRVRLGESEDEQSDFAERISGAAYDTKNQRRAMGEILVNAGIISQRQLEKALEEQQGNKQRRLGNILVEKGLIPDEIVAQVLASQLRLPFVRLADIDIAPEASRLMNGRLATHHMSIPIRYEDETVTVAMANPHDLIAIEDIEIETESKVLPVVATLADITSAIVRVYGVDSSSTQSDSPEVA